MVPRDFRGKRQITDINALLLKRLSGFLIEAFSNNLLRRCRLIEPQTDLIRILLIVILSRHQRILNDLKVYPFSELVFFKVELQLIIFQQRRPLGSAVVQLAFFLR